MDWNLFLSTYALIFVAELPDKTAFATLLMATKGHPGAIFVGTCAAFVIQSVIAVYFGSLFALLPARWVHLLAGALFLVFAGMALRREDEPESEESGTTQQVSFWKAASASFMVIFVAEWGDLTQLATASLEARYQRPWTIFASSTFALWSVTALAVAVGSRARHFLRPKLLNRIAAVAFFVVGLYMLVS